MSNVRTDYAEIAAEHYEFAAEERQRLIEPLIGFFEGVNALRDDQKAHLVTLYQYHQALDVLAAAEARASAAGAQTTKEWERVGVLALKLDEWADDLNNHFLTDIASELHIMAQIKMIAALAATGDEQTGVRG